MTHKYYKFDVFKARPKLDIEHSMCFSFAFRMIIMKDENAADLHTYESDFGVFSPQ